MCLQAIVNNSSSASYLKSYNMIFGNGSTSSSKLRIDDKNGHTVSLALDSLTSSNFDNSTQGVWKRDFNYSDSNVNITLKQTIAADSANKKYNISYEIVNNGTSAVDVDFMFHADTAYNNNDICEGYFINGNRVASTCLYAGSNSDYKDSANSNEGVDIVINEMNSDILGIKGLSMSDSSVSTRNISKIQGVLDLLR